MRGAMPMIFAPGTQGASSNCCSEKQAAPRSALTSTRRFGTPWFVSEEPNATQSDWRPRERQRRAKHATVLVGRLLRRIRRHVDDYFEGHRCGFTAVLASEAEQRLQYVSGNQSPFVL